MATDPSAVTSAAERWRRDLESWAIPAEILAAAPESPWGFPPSLFARAAALAMDDDSPTPSRQRALGALRAAIAAGAGATVLDVGAGGGAASLPLAPPATHLVAVDESEAMLERFAAGAGERSTPSEVIAGRWPDVAGSAPVTDVVTCHHVFYNVQDLAPFVAALSEHARRRVVVELTAQHPLSGLNSLWLEIHGLVRPERPVAADALAVVRDLGYRAEVEYFDHPSLWDGAPLDERVAFARRSLCARPEDDPAILRHFEELASSGQERRQLAAIWWDV